jgi:2-keto-4-pentenoate hydratase
MARFAGRMRKGCPCLAHLRNSTSAGRPLVLRRSAHAPPRCSRPPVSEVRDPASGVLNGPEVAAYAVALADAVGAVLDAGDVPLTGALARGLAVGPWLTEGEP